MVLATLKDVACFVTFNRSRLPHDIRIPCFVKTDALRKRRGGNRCRPTPFPRPALRQAMNSFDVPAPFDSQTRHTRIRAQTRDLFIERQQRKDVVYPLINRQIGILKGVLVPRTYLCGSSARCCMGEKTTERKK